MGKTALLWKFQELLNQKDYTSVFIQSYTVRDFREFYNLIFEIGDGITFTEFVQKGKEKGLAEGTARKLISRICKKHLVEKINSRYKLCSKLFRQWLEISHPFSWNKTAGK